MSDERKDTVDPFEIVDPQSTVDKVELVTLVNDEASRALQFYSSIMPSTSFNVAHKQGRIDAYNITIGQDYDLRDAMDAEIELVGYHMYLGVMDTENPKRILRCALIDADGTTYGCASDGIIRSLSGIIKLFGLPPWRPPVVVRPFSKINPSTKHTFHGLKIVRVD